MKPKLLFITSQLPELSSGSQVRSFYMLQYLKKTYQVTLCCVTDQEVDIQKFKRTIHDDSHIYPIKLYSFIQKIGSLLYGSIPYVQRYRESIPHGKLEALLSKTDVCFCTELNGFFIAERGLTSGIKTVAKMVIDAHNVEYIKFAGEVSSQGFISHLLGLVTTPIMKRIETNALKKMSLIFACSEQDKLMLQQLVPSVKIVVIPNGVDCKKFTPESTRGGSKIEKSLFFMGSLGYPPNDDALKFFLEKIFPTIKKRVSGVTFTIIGKGARPWLQSYAKHDRTVHLEGFVPDVREYINAATVCICPLRFGSGTRLKILEYMVLGKPVVATHIGAEGINLKDGETTCLADTPKLFIEKIMLLLNNPDLAKKIGVAARKTICEQYDWEKIISGAVEEMTLV